MAPVSRDGTSEATSSRNPSPPEASPQSSVPPRPSGSSRPNKGVHAGIQIPYTSTHIHIPRKFHSMTAGAGAGLVSSIVTCPLDVVKTRLQAQHLATTAEDYEGVRKTIVRIWRQAGFRGFYRGLGPTLGGYLPTWGIYFTVYDLVKDRLGEWSRSGTGAHPGAETALLHVIAAMSAGASGTVLTNPLWVVKTRFMAQATMAPSSARYRNTLDAVVTIYRTEGFRAFYKGLLPSLMGVSHVAVQFPLYEKAKSWADSNRDGDHSTLPPSTILGCSAFSKMVASLITYPHEVLRTRLQIRRTHSAPSPTASPPLSTTQHVTPTGSSSRPPLLFPSNHRPLYSPLVSGSDPPLPRPAMPLTSTGSAETVPPKDNRWKGRQGGIVDTFLSIRRQDGWRGFYRGLSINLVRTVPNSAVTMLTYELIMREL